MRPERHTATSVAVIGYGGRRAAQKLHQEPVAQHDPCRQIKEEKDREPYQHTCPWVQHKISAENTGDSSAGTYGGHSRVRIQDELRERSAQSADHVEDQRLEVTQLVLNAVAKDPQEPHIA